jgi:hypothetical protein
MAKKARPKRAETDAQAFPDFMERVRANHALVSGGPEDVQMAAFLELFHPNLPEQRKREAINAVRKNKS